MLVVTYLLPKWVRDDEDKYIKNITKLKELAGELSKGVFPNIENEMILYLYSNRWNIPDLKSLESKKNRFLVTRRVHSYIAAIFSHRALKSLNRLSENDAKLFSLVLILNFKVSVYVNNIFSDLDKNSKSYPVKMRGIDMMQNGNINSIIGLFSMYFIEDHGMPVDQVLLQSIKEVFKRTVEEMMPVKQEQLVAYLNENIKPNIRKGKEKEYFNALNALNALNSLSH